jgi:hypothetical protein
MRLWRHPAGRGDLNPTFHEAESYLVGAGGRYALPVQSAPASVAVRQGSGRGEPARTRVRGWFSARPTLAAAVIYAVLSVAMVGQGLTPGRTLSGSDSLLSSVPWQSSKPASVPGLGTNFELADASNVFQPMLRYTRSQLPSVPLWNPYVMAGRPLLADGQSSVFSPFSLPSYVIGFWRSLAVAAALKLFVGALGTFLLARVLGMRFGGALLSGVVFAFGTFFVVWLAWPLSSVYAFIPWTLAATELAVRRPGRLSAAGLAAAVGLQFLGGHPESSFHLMFVAVVWFAFRALEGLRRRGGVRALVAPTLTFAAGLAAGAGLAALVLAPFAEFILHSGDLSHRLNAAAGFWPRKYLGALFLHDYWGRPTEVDLESFMQVRGWYAGAVTLMLAAAALIARRSAERIAVVLFAAFCVCMVVGIGPVFTVVSSLPGFNAAHNERLLIYVLMSLALLAGWGLDDLCAAQLPAALRRRLTIGAGVTIFCIPIAWLIVAGTLSVHELGAGLKVAWGFVHPPQPPPGSDVEASRTAAIVRDSSLLIWLPLAGAGLALIAWRLHPRRPLPVNVFVGLTVLLLAADLFRANMGFNPSIPTKTALPPATGAIRYLQHQRPNRFVGVSTLQLSQPLPADLSMTYGLYDARGYDFPVEKRFDALWRRNVAPGVGDFTQPEEFASATPASLRALDLLSVSDLMIGPLQAIKSPLHGAGLHVVYRGSDAVIYRNSRALPRVFVVDHQTTVANDHDALAAVTAPGFDGRGVAVTEKPVAGLARARTAATPHASARLAHYGAQRIVIDAAASRRSLVVLTDDFYPGWTATVDGHPATVRRVDYLLRGVEVGPGRHTIVMRYEPKSWLFGWIVSLICLAGLLVAVAGALITRRRRPAAAAAA